MYLVVLFRFLQNWCMLVKISEMKTRQDTTMKLTLWMCGWNVIFAFYQTLYIIYALRLMTVNLSYFFSTGYVIGQMPLAPQPLLITSTMWSQYINPAKDVTVDQHTTRTILCLYIFIWSGTHNRFVQTFIALVIFVHKSQ